ncbi:hypothetical protein TYRP_020211 [Tyrophagus putrescentiae]|nr:hypothetical protein TYRP_020211 [Tyrophagus putrescentiae]
MSSADIPPFVFAFKMLILFIAVVTFFMAGKFLAGLFHSATINKAEEKAKWNEKKRRQANRKARKRAAEAEETLATAATALQLVEEMVEQVVRANSDEIGGGGKDKDQGKPTSGFNILEMAKRKRKQAVEQVVEVKVEVEKELFSDADDDGDDEEGEVDSDTVATTPISVTSDTSAAVVAASFSSSSSADEVPTAYAEAVADKVDKVKDIPSKTLKTPVENTLSSSSFVAITFSPPVFAPAAVLLLADDSTSGFVLLFFFSPRSGHFSGRG